MLFEIVSRVPLFPGTNEMDMLGRIHGVLGTPSREVLRGMTGGKGGSKWEFARKQGTGVRGLIPHAEKECVDLIEKMLVYDPDERYGLSS